MGNDNSQPVIKQWLQTIAGLFTAVTGFVAAVVGFIQLWQGSTGLVTLILLVIGIGSLWLTCLFYVRFWQPEKNDTGLKPEPPSNFAPQEDHEEYEEARHQFEIEQTKKAIQRRKIRRVAWLGLIAVPLLSVAGFTGWHQWQNHPSTDVVILVAEFDGPDTQNYRVTDTILGNLRDAVEKYPNVKVRALEQSITERDGSEVAREIGEKNKADILIWGWYGKTKDQVSLSVNFEILQFSEELLPIEKEAKGYPQYIPVAELESFELQSQLSHELTYLTMATLGVVSYIAGDQESGISLLQNALMQVQEPVSALNQSILHLFIGNLFLRDGDYEKAIQQYDQATYFDTVNIFTYINRGLAHAFLGKSEKAIEDHNFVISILDVSQVPRFCKCQAYNSRGLVYMLQNEYELAIQDFSRSINIDNNYVPSRINRGLTYILQGEFGKAKNDLDFVINLSPNSSRAFATKGLLEIKTDKLEEAINSYKRSIDLDHRNALSFYNLGNIYAVQREYDEAIKYLQKATEIQPGNASFWNSMGAVYLEEGSYDVAIELFIKAIKLEPSLTVSYTNLGIIYRSQGNQRKAESFFSKALKTAPNSVQPYLDRAVIYEDLGEYGKAAEDYQKALEIIEQNHSKNNTLNYELDCFAQNPDKRGAGFDCLFNFDDSVNIDEKSKNLIKEQLSNVYLIQGAKYVDQKKHTLGLQKYNQAIQLTPNFARAYIARARNYFDQGNYKFAIQDSSRAIELDGSGRDGLMSAQLMTAYLIRGNAYLQMNQYDQAISDLTKATELEQGYDEVWSSRGVAYFYRKEFAKSVQDFDRAIRLSQTNDSLYISRGTVFCEQNNFDQAIADFSKAIELNPENAFAYYRRSICYKNMGERDKAILDLEKTLELIPDQELQQLAEQELRNLGITP